MAKRKGVKKPELRSVMLTLRNGATAINAIEQLNGCIDCDVSVSDTKTNSGAWAKKITVSPATIRPRGGAIRLKAKVGNPIIIDIQRREVINYKQIPLTI